MWGVYVWWRQRNDTLQVGAGSSAQEPCKPLGRPRTAERALERPWKARKGKPEAVRPLRSEPGAPGGCAPTKSVNVSVLGAQNRKTGGL